MKHPLATILLAALALSVAAPASAQYEQRKEQATGGNTPLADFRSQQRQLFNFGWRFQLVTADNKATDFASPSLDDSAWRTLDLPHDFQFEQPWTQKGSGARGFKPMCEGWYRKTFRADSTWRGKRVTLDFGGIIYLGDVYLNGHKIASTDYGYVGLEADLTKHLNFEGDNVVAVYASTGPKKGSRWFTGGGLFRDVYLQVQNPTHVSRHGLYVSTPDVSRTEATVQVQVEVEGWQRKNVTLLARVKDAEGKVVGTSESAMPQHTHQSRTEVKLPLVSVKAPKLWSPDTPYLYKVEALVKAGGVVVDSLADDFGIRKLEFSPEYGFRLNGEKIFLQGNAGHHDMGALGAAAFDDGIERTMRQLKAFGFNTIRCSHNPYSESFARIADRVGLLVVDELIDKWSDHDYWGGREPFTGIWYKLIPEWIKRDRNRASVILWSLGNELQIRNDWAGFEGTNDYGVTTYRIFRELVRRFDPTRLTTVAMFPARAGAISRKDKDFGTYLLPPELSEATDVCALNYQSDKYAAYRQHNPQINIFQSEAETSGLLAPYYNMDRDHSIGMAYWGAIEYWGESNGWPKKGWNFSFFSHTLRPYPQAWLVKSAFEADKPTVRLGVVDAKGGETVSWNDVLVGRPAILDHWNFDRGSRQNVMAYTNAYEVELLVNGKSVGKKLNNDTVPEQRNCILFANVEYANGGSVEAIARDASGREVARHRMETATEAVRLVVEPESTVWKADGMSLLYLDIRAVDKKGRTVPSFQDSLTVSVDGQAQLLALDNGDHYTGDLFYGVTRKPMRGGCMQVILRSTRKAGRVTLTAQAGRLRQTLKTATK